VYAPVTDELYSAGRGCGATLDGAPVHSSAASSLDLALVATGFSYRPERRAAQGRRLARLIVEVRDVRRSGSAALDLCSVACGRVDAYFEDFLNSWDIAAGLLIATEAGALASGLRGGPATPAGVVVSAPDIHDSLLGALAASD
jgi:myo-inositol-1(or 4)-monophosphatase